jgi:hypothetical protein
MKLWMSGEIDSDIADAFRSARRSVENEVNDLLNKGASDDSIQEWDVIPIIRVIDSPDFNEVVKKSKRGKSLEFRLKIPHENFRASDPRQQIALIIKMLYRSVDLMEQLGVKEELRRKLYVILSNAEKYLTQPMM